MSHYKEHIFSVDLEDWFTTGHYKKVDLSKHDIKYSVESVSYKLLELLEIKKSKATFFVLGSLAENLPKLVEDIAKQGHEVASHGYSHTPLYDLTPALFEEEIIKTNEILESLSGKKIIGFRAPFFSLNQQTSWAIDVLKKHQFIYDASIFPIKTPLYGVTNAPLSHYPISSDNLLAESEKSSLIEFPHSVFQKGFIKIPCAGGIYSRFLPFSILKKMLVDIAKREVIQFYTHPWELHYFRPANIKINPVKRFLAHHNTRNHLQKISRILSEFSFISYNSFIEKNLMHPL